MSKIDLEKEAHKFLSETVFKGFDVNNPRLSVWFLSIAERVERETIERCKEHGYYDLDGDPVGLNLSEVPLLYSPAPSDVAISQCPACLCMTHTIEGRCGKCKGKKS